MGVKAGKKRKQVVQEDSSDEEGSVDLPPPTRSSDDPIPKKVFVNESCPLLLGYVFVLHVTTVTSPYVSS